MKPAAALGSIRRRLVIQLSVVAAILSLIFILSVRTVGKNTAQTTQDSVLLAAATSISDSLRMERGRIVVDIPYSAFSMLGAVSEDRIYYRIDVDGITETGYEDLPVVPALSGSGDEQPFFASRVYRENDIRTVTVKRTMSTVGAPVDVHVIIAQTQSGFAQVASHVFSIATAIGAVFFVLAILLCLLAAQNALRPLTAITRAVRKRGPEDLSPVEKKVPAEVYPLVAALNSFIARLDTALQRADEFIADAAHRIRTPMAMVQTNAEIALRTTRSASGRRAIKEVIRATEETSRSAGQLLDHATVAFRSENLKLEPVNLSELVLDSINRFSPIADMKSITIRFDSSIGGAMCRSDTVLLQSAIGNVLDNAIKYSPTDSAVRVAVGKDSDHFRISICDRGRGFRESEPVVLAKRFARGENSGDVIGTGLGLTIVSDVVAAHDGRLEISQNTGGCGSCVSISLPA